MPRVSIKQSIFKKKTRVKHLFHAQGSPYVQCSHPSPPPRACSAATRGPTRCPRSPSPRRRSSGQRKLQSPHGTRVGGAQREQRGGGCVRLGERCASRRCLPVLCPADVAKPLSRYHLPAAVYLGTLFSRRRTGRDTYGKQPRGPSAKRSWYRGRSLDRESGVR